METQVGQVTWAGRYGITRRDWDTFRRYAGERHVYLFLQGGRAAAIQWIERGFPARPADLGGLDVDRELGLVVARGEAQRHRVFAHCHYVLTPAGAGGGGPGGLFIGVNPRQPPLRVTFQERWARAGIVIDRRTHRPFTSGYELLAILGEGDEFHHFQTLGSAVAAAPPLGWRRGDDPGRGTRFVDRVRQDLNGLTGSGRVLDGTRASVAAPGPREASGSALDRDHDILVFRPDGVVGLLGSPAGGWARLEVRSLMAALLPERSSLSSR